MRNQAMEQTLLKEKSAIIRTERGLTIAGTRITLYDVMDYREYPPKFIRSLLDLTEAQINTALSYIEANREQVETEYQIVLKQAEESRQYWEKRHQEHFAQKAVTPSKLNRDLLWKKLQTQKAKHNLKA